MEPGREGRFEHIGEVDVFSLIEVELLAGAKGGHPGVYSMTSSDPGGLDSVQGIAIFFGKQVSNFDLLLPMPGKS